MLINVAATMARKFAVIVEGMQNWAGIHKVSLTKYTAL
jgi:hypothetical protein